MTKADWTRTKADWLRRAYHAGYDEGFVAEPCKELLALEQSDLVERNPTTSGKHTQWRITAIGQATVESGQVSKLG